MRVGLRVAVLTSRDLVRHGVRGMLEGLPMPVQYSDSIDSSYPADVIVVGATGTTDAGSEGLEAVTGDELAPVVVLTSRAVSGVQGLGPAGARLRVGLSDRR